MHYQEWKTMWKLSLQIRMKAANSQGSAALLMESLQFEASCTGRQGWEEMATAKTTTRMRTGVLSARTEGISCAVRNAPRSSIWLVMFQHFLAFQGTHERIDFLLFTCIRKKQNTTKLGQAAFVHQCIHGKTGLWCYLLERLSLTIKCPRCKCCSINDKV